MLPENQISTQARGKFRYLDKGLQAFSHSKFLCASQEALLPSAMCVSGLLELVRQ